MRILRHKKEFDLAPAVVTLASGQSAEDHLLFPLAECYFFKAAKYGLPSEQIEADSELVRECDRRADLYVIDLNRETERVRGNKISIGGLEHP